MNVPIVIKDKPTFEKIFQLINTAFLPWKNLPEQVFNQDYGNFLVHDFNYAMTPEFWKSVQSGPLSKGNHYIFTSVLDPDPVKYFYPEFGSYNTFKFPLDTSPDEYWETLEKGPEESPSDAVLYNSRVVVWASDSLNWAIWADRDLEICIIGFNQKINGVNILLESSWFASNHWMNMETAITESIPSIFYHQGGKIPQAIEVGLREGYSERH